MKTKVAVVGGTSLLSSSIFSHLKPTTIDTPYGKAIVYTNEECDSDIIFVQRHHADGEAGVSVYRPPHLINHQANFHAISQFQPQFVLAVCSVGSLKPSSYPSGTLLFPDDYFALISATFCVYDDQRAHIVPGISNDLRSILIDSLKDKNIEGLNTSDGVTYVQTAGPRFETPSESRFLSNCGDIVGMTGANEATAAKELNLDYAIMAMIDNSANGLAEKVLTSEEFKEGVARHQVIVENAAKICIDNLLTKSS